MSVQRKYYSYFALAILCTMLIDYLCSKIFLGVTSTVLLLMNSDLAYSIWNLVPGFHPLLVDVVKFWNLENPLSGSIPCFATVPPVVWLFYHTFSSIGHPCFLERTLIWPPKRILGSCYSCKHMVSSNRGSTLGAWSYVGTAIYRSRNFRSKYILYYSGLKNYGNTLICL